MTDQCPNPTTPAMESQCPPMRMNQKSIQKHPQRLPPLSVIARKLPRGAPIGCAPRYLISWGTKNMSHIDDLRLELSSCIDEQQSIRSRANDEHRDLSETEHTQVNGILDRVEDIKAQIEQDTRARKLSDWSSTSQDDNEPRPDIGESGNSKRYSGSQPARFGSFGEYLIAVCRAAQPGHPIDPRLHQRASGMSEGVPADGGFLVQTDFAAELLKRTYATGVVASRCRKIPISSNANGIKLNAVAETSRADGSRWGGVKVYWEHEGATKTETQPELRQIELTLKKLIGLCYATDELLQDATALEAVIMQAFSEEFGFRVDDAIINGNGAVQMLGILNSPALVTVNAEGGQAADTIIYENIVSMWSRMYGPSRLNAAWYINQDIEPQLYTMSLAVGTGGQLVYLPPGGASGTPYATLFGKPVIPIEQASTVGTVGDIILADMSQYLLADKGGVQSDRSIHVKFTTDETTFRFVYRVDGQPWWSSALTPKSGSANTLSPFVALASRD